MLQIAVVSLAAFYVQLFQTAVKLNTPGLGSWHLDTSGRREMI